MQDTKIETIDQAKVLEAVLIHGDLSVLTPVQKVAHLQKVCESLGLNPLTNPLKYIKMTGKLVLYAGRDCTDQLRKIHGVSCKIVSREKIGDVFMVTAQATLPSGRVDESIGAVDLTSLKGVNLANALMITETKAKRRVTLSICGLGYLDETEVDSVPGVEHVMPPTVEVIEEESVEGKAAVAMDKAEASKEKMLAQLWVKTKDAGVTNQSVEQQIFDKWGRGRKDLTTIELQQVLDGLDKRIVGRNKSRGNP